MSRIRIATLLIVVVSITGCQKSGSPEPGPAPSGQPAVTMVTVTFTGLMVFHEESSGGPYEVGILDDSMPSGHKHIFTITLDNVEQPLPDLGSWRFEVIGGGNVVQTPLENGHPDRFHDVVAGQYDFSWMIDLDGSDFHGRPLRLQEGLLKPIIHLSQANLYTPTKTEVVRRWQDPAHKSDYGFIAEQVAMNFMLSPGQELVLKKDGSGDVILRQTYDRPGSLHRVEIKNIRETCSRESDFYLYYALFPDVIDAEKYDFDLNESAGMHPLNPYPRIACLFDADQQALLHRQLAQTEPFATCCWLPCNSIRLVNLGGPLR